MSYVVVSTKIDPQTKKEAMATAESMGLPLSVVIKAFLKQFIRTKTVTFSATPDEVPNEYLKSVMKKAEGNYRKGHTSPSFSNIKDELKWLEKQGI